jgi:NAD(P)H-dependent flavin oxidoreductase YrpB (nitropropane dioxygenase family)
MPLTTPLTQQLGLVHPLIQGGMQWVGVAELVAAVSNAGALGILTALTQPNPAALREEIRRTRKMLRPDVAKRCKLGPFGVNVTLLRKWRALSARRSWRPCRARGSTRCCTTSAIAARRGQSTSLSRRRHTSRACCSLASLRLTPSPASISPPDYPGYVQAALDEGVRIFETAGNNPGPVIKQIKDAGGFVIHK